MGPRPTWLHARARISVPRSPCGESRFSTVTSTRAAARVLCLVPRGQALGVTFQSPDNDRYGYGAADLRGRIVGALGGHAAEELVYGDVTTGAESDLEQLTSIARQMVGRWGMSDAIGKVSVLPRPDEESNFLPGAARASDQTLELVDVEVRRIVDECYDEALEQLRANRDRLDRLARALLEHETLDEADAYRIAGIDGPAGSCRWKRCLQPRRLRGDGPPTTTWFLEAHDPMPQRGTDTRARRPRPPRLSPHPRPF